MTDIAAIVPVAPSEPLAVVERSVDSLTALRVPDDATMDIIYVIDTHDADSDGRVTMLQERGDVETVVREPGEGRRAGAINAGLDHAGRRDRVALFDVDSRPEQDFLAETLPAFADDTYFVTAPRSIVNADTNTITRMIDTEFRFFTDMQRLLTRGEGFFHANGLIGVLDGDYLRETRLDPDRLCADTDVSERAYADGKHARMVRGTSVGEQAVTTLDDLYSQKQRWLQGAIEGLRYHTRPMMSTSVDQRITFSWLLTMIAPFFAALFSPLAFGYAAVRYGTRPVEAVHRGVGFFMLTWIVSVAGAGAILKNMSGTGVDWTVPQREDL